MDGRVIAVESESGSQILTVMSRVRGVDKCRCCAHRSFLTRLGFGGLRAEARDGVDHVGGGDVSRQRDMVELVIRKRGLRDADRARDFCLVEPSRFAGRSDFAVAHSRLLHAQRLSGIRWIVKRLREHLSRYCEIVMFGRAARLLYALESVPCYTDTPAGRSRARRQEAPRWTC